MTKLHTFHIVITDNKWSMAFTDEYTLHAHSAQEAINRVMGHTWMDSPVVVKLELVRGFVLERVPAKPGYIDGMGA